MGRLIKEMENYNKSIAKNEQELALLNSEIIPLLRERQLAEEAYARAIESNTAQANTYIDDLKRRSQAEVEYASLVRSASSQQIEDKISALKEQISADQNYANALREQLEENQSYINDMSQYIGQEGFADVENTIAGLVEANKAYTEALAEAETSIFHNQEAIESLSGSILDQVQSREQEIAARDAEKEKIEEEKKALEEVTKKRGEYVNQIRSIEGELEKIALDRRKEELKQSKILALEQDQQARRSALQKQIDIAKQAEAEKKIAESQSKIRSEALDKEKSVTAKYTLQEQKARHDLNTSIRKVNQDFMQSEMQAVQSYRLQEERNTRDYNQKRLETLRKMSADLEEAALDNDVKSFIRIQKQGSQDLSSLDTTYNTGASDRSVDFQNERALALQNREAKIKDLVDQYNAEKEQRQIAKNAEIADIRQQTQEKLTALRESNQAILSESSRLQEQMRLLEHQFQMEKQAMEQQAQAENMRNRISSLQQERQRLIQEMRMTDRATSASAASIGNNAGINLLKSLNASLARGVAQMNMVNNNRPVQVVVQNQQVGSLVTPNELNTQLNQFSKAVSNALSRAFGR
jgi:DNA repair exonuclease SbcCD ATPase subunit